MRKKIEIAQFASGSWTDNIGDTTLFYSAGYSRHANDVSGLFLDNPPVLSPRYASVAWLYYQDVDKYILMHVQGSHVVNIALGRNYPFRAGYEVSREDMNQIGYSLRDLFSQMPRIKGMPSGRVDSSRFIDISPTQPSESAMLLAEHIQKAIITGRQLNIALPVTGETFKCDNVLDSSELALLLEAIESLPLHLRRYATFGFCIDEHYDMVMSDALVKVYVADSKMTIAPDALQMSWQDAISSHSPLSRDEKETLSAIHLPGEETPLLTYGEFKKAFSIYDKSAENLIANEWHIWLSLGHSLTDLHTDNWDEMRRYHQTMDSATQEQYVDLIRTASLRWPVEGLDEATYGLMQYNDSEKYQLQSKTLKEYLLSDGNRYRYLFGVNGLSDEVKGLLNGQFIERLNLKDRGSIEWWLGVFEQQGAMNNDGVKKAFVQLYKTHILDHLQTMDEIVSCMRRCPFIPANAFKKPKTIFKPRQTDDLKEGHRQLIEQWVDEAVDSIRFEDLNEVTHILRLEKKKGTTAHSLEAESLRRMTAEELVPLLRGKGKEEDIFERCDNLLKECASLPASWDSFVCESAIKACFHTLFTNKSTAKGNAPWPDDRIHDVNNWPKLGKLYKNYPYASTLIKNRIEKLGAHKDADSIANRLKKTFSKTAAKSDDSEETRTPYKKAETAYPIIKTFLSTYKKQNKAMAKELDKIFKDLKKSDKQRGIRAWLNLLVGLVAGLVIGCGGLMTYQLINKPKPVVNKAPLLVLANDDTDNLMLRLADMGVWKDISEVKIDTTTVKGVNLEDINSLLTLSKTYYEKADLGIQEAKVVVREKTDQPEKSQPDTLTFSSQQPLLSIVSSKPYQIEQVLVNDTLKISIPTKELFGEKAAEKTTEDARYYLDIIKYVGSKMPSEIEIAY